MAQAADPSFLARRHTLLQFIAYRVHCKFDGNTFSSTDHIGPKLGEINMFTAANRTSRFISFSFAILMTVVVNGGMLMTFDKVAQDATLAQASKAQAVAVLETVTIVARRI